MSSDRLERRLPEVLTELSLPRVPDYVDNLLSRTERMSQRPGWTFPERWFPVSAITEAMPASRRLPFRPLMLVAILVALAIVAVVLIVGSQKRLPPLYGPARNGAVLTTDASENVILLDPATGTTRTLATGPDLCCAGFSPDGQLVGYLSIPNPNNDPAALRVVNLEGKVVLEIPAEAMRGNDWFEWSPAGDRILLTSLGEVSIVDVATGKTTPIDVSFHVQRASWIGVTGDILLTSQIADAPPEDQKPSIYRLPAGATSNPTKVTDIQYLVEPPQVSPDGSKFLYFIWGPEERLHGRIHVFDFATGVDTAVTAEDEASNAGAKIHSVEGPQWSPDGSLIAAWWFWTDGDQIGIIRADGGDPVYTGERKQGGFGQASSWHFSPDGKFIVMWSPFDGSNLLLPVTGGPGQRVGWGTGQDFDWQRLAP